MPHYDLIVIGSGPAGNTGAVHAASMGKRVALIEAQPRLGGACVNTGTLPSKTLRESALYLSGLDQRGLWGVDRKLEGGITVDRFLYREQQVVQKQLELIQREIERHDIDLFDGWGTLENDHTVRVKKRAGTTLSLTADMILLTTGSYPYRPSYIPFDDHFVYDSDTILRLDSIPGSLTILGAGPIGCEYACIFAALGVEVVLLDPHEHILTFLDGEIVSTLVRRMKRLGIEVLLEEEVKSVSVEAGQVTTCLKSGQVIETARFLFAAGRSGATRDLGLDRVGVAVNERGYIQVDEYYQTASPHIYAAGDVIGFPALASTGMEQGRIAVTHAFAPEYSHCLAQTLPYGLYTIPEVSMAGETEESCRKKGIDYEIGCASYENNARGQIVGDTDGMLKLIVARDDLRLLGVHLLGENATELVHIGMTCMYHGGGLDSFTRTVFNYPTLAGIYKEAAFDALRRLSGGKGMLHTDGMACPLPGAQPLRKQKVSAK